MTRTIGKLADRLLSAVAPRATALAGYEYKCESCGSPYTRLDWRYCASGCSPWYRGECKFAAC
ncbi:hypothetical protein [Cryptosporangium japonicum]|uniref:Uncharacterized protein n=1 Tax=Cryptosporangium japonicum TaxID=80872 RepID=A0ABN0U6L9_9ACTN